MISLSFYTRQGCPLCDEALAVVGEAARDAGVAVEVIDVDLDLELLGVYNERVPVVELNGEVLAEGPIESPRQFRKKLKRSVGR